jgi:hypothetical protein
VAVTVVPRPGGGDMSQPASRSPFQAVNAVETAAGSAGPAQSALTVKIAFVIVKVPAPKAKVVRRDIPFDGSFASSALAVFPYPPLTLA